MLERFSDESQKVVVVAYQEARLLGHRFVGTEHILLGLIGDRDGIAGRVLAFVGVSQDQARDEIVGIVGSIEEPSTELLFSPRAKALLEVALRQALQGGSNYVETEHLLLGLVHDEECLGAEVLVRQAGDGTAVHRAIMIGMEAKARGQDVRTRLEAAGEADPADEAES